MIEALAQTLTLTAAPDNGYRIRCAPPELAAWPSLQYSVFQIRDDAAAMAQRRQESYTATISPLADARRMS